MKTKKKEEVKQTSTVTQGANSMLIIEEDFNDEPQERDFNALSFGGASEELENATRARTNPEEEKARRQEAAEQAKTISDEDLAEVFKARSGRSGRSKKGGDKPTSKGTSGSSKKGYGKGRRQ
ncbi:hypothetical protein KIPB_001868 [Kipferlia bialata]|uniref:Uncharacterized protein n=1 Tax=Kipferlia bialata TaxID=797122 RepID=A0A9K3CPK5_9EUKA|nr:hypothetical protein KIPB_001855 [Kipferlia bialata]GIQ80979.1 hypothetical protein KIPB_001868 [Kipferlia bialata]|eukprot:g1855.t1